MTDEKVTPNCLNPNHAVRPAKTRGLCATCYLRAGKLIAAKKFSWDQLEKAGKAIAAKRTSGTDTFFDFEVPAGAPAKKK